MFSYIRGTVYEELNASIVYRTDEFTSAERSTSIEIAVIDVTVPNEYGTSIIIENLKQKYYKDEQEQGFTNHIDSFAISTDDAEMLFKCYSGLLFPILIWMRIMAL